MWKPKAGCSGHDCDGEAWDGPRRGQVWGCYRLQGADSPSLQTALLVPGSVAAVTATCKRVRGRERERERETNTGVSGKGTLSHPPTLAMGLG